MTRTTARQLAVQLAFAAIEGSDLSPADFFEEEYFHALPSEDALFAEVPSDKQMRYISELVNGVCERRRELDETISRYSQGWKINRISKTALCILRCAIYEILYMPDIPDAASINEAVELAKSYDEAETVRFINGILGSFMRDRFTETAEAKTDGEG